MDVEYGRLTGSRERSQQAVSALSGFDPERDQFAVSSKIDFYPEDDDPTNYDGAVVTWTFNAPKDAKAGPGLYLLKFVRPLTKEERGNHGAQVQAIAMETRKGGDVKQAPSRSDDSADLQGIAQ